MWKAADFEWSMAVNMEKIFEQGLLYDFYGELLTEHQRKIYEDAVFNDLSLSEIAAEAGISRQGVHDLIKRCDRILQEYEEKLHLMERFAGAKRTVNDILSLTEEALLLEKEAENGRQSGETAAANGKISERSGGCTGHLKRIRELAGGLMEAL